MCALLWTCSSWPSTSVSFLKRSSHWIFLCNLQSCPRKLCLDLDPMFLPCLPCIHCTNQSDMPLALETWSRPLGLPCIIYFSQDLLSSCGYDRLQSLLCFLIASGKLFGCLPPPRRIPRGSCEMSGRALDLLQKRIYGKPFVSRTFKEEVRVPKAFNPFRVAS